MPYSFEQIPDVEWLVISNDEQLSVDSHIADRCIWGKGSGCTEALRLAERYMVRLLVLESCCGLRRYRHAKIRQDLYAIVCPVLIYGCSENAAPDLPNAPVYRIDDAAQLPGAIRALI